MGDMTVGIVLFVLIIAIGLLIGLRLSSTGPQRRAVAVAFASMAVVAILFYVFAMEASQLWTAPIFAVACIVLPIASYTLMMRGQRPAKTAVTRRSASEAPRPAHSEGVNRLNRPPSALEGAVMPVAPNHPVNEYVSLKEMVDEPEADRNAPRHAQGAIDSSFELVAEDLDALLGAEHGERATESESAEAAQAASSSDGASDEADSSTESSSAVSQPVEALIDEYLMEENEDEGGLFEPEQSPTLTPQQAPAPVTSTMMVTIPFEGGDEQYLVVSESTAAPNPIMAYKRTTSSHLVPLGASKRVRDIPVQNEPAPREQTPAAQHGEGASVPMSPKVELADQQPATSPASTAVIMSVVSRKLDAMLQPEEENLAASAEKQPSLFDPTGAFEPVSVSDDDATSSEAAPLPLDAFSSLYEPVAAQDAPQEPASDYEQAVESEERVESASEASAMRVEPQPSAEAAFPEPASVPTASRLEPEPVVEVAAPAPAAAKLESKPAVEIAVESAASEPTPSRSSAMPSAVKAPEPEIAPTPAPAAPEPVEVPFETVVAKADGLREKGLYPVAARLYAQAAAAAPSSAEAHRVLFEEIACYIKAGQGDKARDLAAELCGSSVLTRIERIKLDAIERMG